MNQQVSFFRDPMWQAIGVLVAAVFALLSMLISFVSLSDPARSIIIAFGFIILGALLIAIYIIIIHERQQKRTLYKREKVGLAVTAQVRWGLAKGRETQ